jgi:hypothetical protein
MRQQGHSDADIARAAGLTRSRIGQILGSNPGKRRDPPPTHVGTTDADIIALHKQGYLNTVIATHCGISSVRVGVIIRRNT